MQTLMRGFWLLLCLVTAFSPGWCEEPAVHSLTPSYTLERLEALAIENNPTLQQAHQLIRGEEGKAMQARLWPNPELAYVGEQIGLDNTSGEFQGGLLRQRIVTGGKLSLSRQKYEARADAARDNLSAQKLRILNDVESHFYEILGATRKVELYQDLLGASKDHYKTTKESVNIGKMSQADLRLAGVDLQKARLDLFMAQNDLKGRRRVLESVVGTPLGESMVVDGELNSNIDKPLPDWETLLDETIEKSPQILSALDKLRADEITVKREEVEPFPDIVLEAGLGRNNIDQQTVYSAGVSIEIPLFDRNQGTIDQARADLKRQQLELERLRLSLSRDFAVEYSAYLTQYRNVLDYQNVILPRTQTAFEMQLKMYKANRMGAAL